MPCAARQFGAVGGPSPVPVATTNLVSCRHFACLAWHDNYLSEKSTCGG